jgi:leucine dehydrogenase
MSALEHERVVVARGTRTRLPVIVAIHSTKFGPAAGGCRLSHYENWRDGLDDALRLSEAMTLKCAVAGLPNGGGKSVIALPPGYALGSEERRDLMLDLGDVIEGLGGQYLAGEDVGTTAEDMLVARERTQYAYCLPTSEGGVGEPSEPTAIGVHRSILTTCERLFGTASAQGRRFTVIGLGQVGGRLAARLAQDGGVLAVADIDAGKRALADSLGAQWMDIEDALFAETDVLVPAALGGLFTPESVRHLRCRAICGPANNQLADPAVADLLHERGILWAPDFVVNGGGVLYSALVETGGATKDEAMSRVESVGSILAEIYRLAAADGTTPYAAAEALALVRLSA